ncbi:MAG TPA: FtsX-like permease family protein [Rhodanobacteraceae bacterium]
MPRAADATSADATTQYALVSRALAQRLWPHQDPLGKVMWCCQGTDSFRVIGVVRHLVHAQPRDVESADWSIFVPALADELGSGQYLLRAPPQRVNAVLREARTALATIAPHATVDGARTGTLSELRARYFESNRAIAGMLAGTVAALLLVTALGIVGLTGYWVQQRTRSIGIRRALGATRADILHYFQTENFLIVTFGIALGAVLAIGLNLLLMQHYPLPRLPLGYLPVGALVLWLLGQIAALAPALRASYVSPMVATRNV